MGFLQDGQKGDGTLLQSVMSVVGPWILRRDMSFLGLCVDQYGSIMILEVLLTPSMSAGNVWLSPQRNIDYEPNYKFSKPFTIVNRFLFR